MRKQDKTQIATFAVTFLTSLVSTLMIQYQQKILIKDNVNQILTEERKQIYEAQKRMDKIN